MHLLLLGDFEAARRYAMRGVQIWRSGSVHSYSEEHFTPVVSCLVWGHVRLGTRRDRLLPRDDKGRDRHSKGAER